MRRRLSTLDVQPQQPNKQTPGLSVLMYTYLRDSVSPVQSLASIQHDVLMACSIQHSELRTSLCRPPAKLLEVLQRKRRMECGTDVQSLHDARVVTLVVHRLDNETCASHSASATHCACSAGAHRLVNHEGRRVQLRYRSQSLIACAQMKVRCWQCLRDESKILASHLSFDVV